jgi:hypothetical protein
MMTSGIVTCFTRHMLITAARNWPERWLVRDKNPCRDTISITLLYTLDSPQLCREHDASYPG